MRMCLVCLAALLSSLTFRSSAATNNARPLRTLAEVRAWAAKTTNGTTNFCFSGQALSDASLPCLFFRDGTGFQAIYVNRSANATVSPGDQIVISGAIVRPTATWMAFNARTVAVTAHGDLPPPTDATPSQLSDPALRFSRVRVRGVVFRVVGDDIDANFNWILLRTASGIVRLAVREVDTPLEKAKKWIDAELSAVGFVMPFENLRKPLGDHIIVYRADDLSVIRPAPPDPFRIPAHIKRTDCHRQREIGFVRAVGADGFYVRTANQDCLLVRMPDGAVRPAVGRYLDIVGFPEVHNLQPQFVEAVWRPVSRTERPEPVLPIAFADLFQKTAGRNAKSTSGHNKIVRLTGICHQRFAAGDRPGVFDLTSDGLAVRVDATGFPEAAARARDGARLDITGLCLCEFTSEAADAAFPALNDITIVLRAADELRILSAPPWWTPRRLAVVVGILLVALVGIFVWNRSLLRLSEKRGLRLSREKFARLAAQLKTEERNRLAVELHDSIAQTLTGIAMTVNTVRGMAQTGGEIPLPLLDVAASALKSCREDIRNCLWELRNNALDTPTMKEAIARTLSPHTQDV